MTSDFTPDRSSSFLDTRSESSFQDQCLPMAPSLRGSCFRPSSFCLCLCVILLSLMPLSELSFGGLPCYLLFLNRNFLPTMLFIKICSLAVSHDLFYLHRLSSPSLPSDPPSHFLTNLFPISMAFCLFPSVLDQGCLCDHRIGTVHWVHSWVQNWLPF